MPRLQREHGFDGAIAFFTIPCGPAALRLHRLHRVPYVVSLRGGDVPGHVPGLNLMHALTRPVRRAVLRQARAIVANSEGLAATSRAADPFPVQIVPTGVDGERFHPAPEAEARPTSAPLRLIYVGRVHPEKNLGMVISQLGALPAKLRDGIELTVVGDGAQRAELETLGAQLGISRHIRWLGWRDKASLPELYRSADVLVNPSQYEGMPNVALEAMATALPVVASDVPGNRSVVSAETGVLFPLDRPAELGAALARLATNRTPGEEPWGRPAGSGPPEGILLGEAPQRVILSYWARSRHSNSLHE